MRLYQLAIATIFGAAAALPLTAPVFAQTPAPAAITAPAKPLTAAPVAPVTPAAPAAPATKAPAAATAKADKKAPFTGTVSINTGTAADLDKLYGIGKSRTAKIIAGRPYKAIDELTSRKILPQSVFDKISKQLTL